LNIKQNLKGDVMVLNLSGKIMGGPDHDKFQTEVKTLISSGYVDILLDMSKVNWLNSVGLGTIMASSTTLSNAGGELKVAGLQDKARGLFSIAKLDSVFKMYGTAERAAADF